MTPHLETLETVGRDLDEARAKLAATRESLQAFLDAQGDIPEFRQAVARLERIEAQITKVERVVENHCAVVRAPG
jgi:hypothetical protein